MIGAIGFLKKSSLNSEGAEEPDDLDDSESEFMSWNCSETNKLLSHQFIEDLVM